MQQRNRDAITFLAAHPAAVGRLCGFTRLTDALHGDWLRQMLLGETDITLLAHRGSYKTTCLSLAMALTLALQPEKTLLFLRKTDADVREVIAQTAAILRHPALRELTARVWGEPVTLARATEDTLVTSVYTAARGAPQLRGQGIGGSLTGKHADLILTDDIVNLTDRLSSAERQRTRTVYQELQNIRNRGGRMINTGTPWHPEDAISLMPAPQRFDCYSTGLIAPEELRALRASMSPSLFAANYELRHIAEADALFALTPPFTEDTDCLRDGIAHVDAGYGGGDGTALTCGRFDGERLYLYGRLWRAHVNDCLEEIGAVCDRLLCGPLWMETNGDRGYLAREARRRGIAVHPYAERMNKHIKISTYLRAWWPRVTLVAGTDPAWLREILGYTPQAEHDDAPDSAASLVRALRIPSSPSPNIL